jgi:hypothetical protein
MRVPHNKSLHRTFDPLLIFASAKTGIASNAGELRRYRAGRSPAYLAG